MGTGWPGLDLRGAAVRTKNAAPITAAERAHIGRIKELPCSVCDAPGPSDAHHVVQGQHWTVIALCKDCHQGPRNGWHGRRLMWAIKKLDEWGALAITIKRLMA